MEINNENDVATALQLWQGLSKPARVSRARKSIEKLEMNQMYYEQKGNEKSAGRTGACIQIIKKFLVSCET